MKPLYRPERTDNVQRSLPESGSYSSCPIKIEDSDDNDGPDAKSFRPNDQSLSDVHKNDYLSASSLSLRTTIDNPTDLEGEVRGSSLSSVSSYGRIEPRPSNISGGLEFGLVSASPSSLETTNTRTGNIKKEIRDSLFPDRSSLRRNTQHRSNISSSREDGLLNMSSLAPRTTADHHPTMSYFSTWPTPPSVDHIPPPNTSVFSGYRPPQHQTPLLSSPPITNPHSRSYDLLRNWKFASPRLLAANQNPANRSQTLLSDRRSRSPLLGTEDRFTFYDDDDDKGDNDERGLLWPEREEMSAAERRMGARYRER